MNNSSRTRGAPQLHLVTNRGHCHHEQRQLPSCLGSFVPVFMLGRGNGHHHDEQAKLPSQAYHIEIISRGNCCHVSVRLSCPDVRRGDCHNHDSPQQRGGRTPPRRQLADFLFHRHSRGRWCGWSSCTLWRISVPPAWSCLKPLLPPARRYCRWNSLQQLLQYWFASTVDELLQYLVRRYCRKAWNRLATSVCIAGKMGAEQVHCRVGASPQCLVLVRLETGQAQQGT